jgi:hypothetical protein
MALRQCLVFPALTLLAALVACHPQHAVFQTDNSVAIPCSRQVAYFPPFKTGAIGLVWGQDQVDWETHTLRRMGEPSLYSCTKPQPEPMLRFLWDRSLSAPISARLIVHSNGTGTLIVRMLSSGTLMPPPLPNEKQPTEDDFYRRTVDREIRLTTDQVNHILALLMKIRFVTDRNVPNTTDGSDWIFETEEAGRYSLVDFRNEPSSSAKELGLYLVRDMGHISLPESAIY